MMRLTEVLWCHYILIWYKLLKNWSAHLQVPICSEIITTIESTDFAIMTGSGPWSLSPSSCCWTHSLCLGFLSGPSQQIPAPLKKAEDALVAAKNVWDLPRKISHQSSFIYQPIRFVKYCAVHHQICVGINHGHKRNTIELAMAGNLPTSTRFPGSLALDT